MSDHDQGRRRHGQRRLLVSAAVVLATLVAGLPAEAAVTGTVRVDVSTTGAQVAAGWEPYLSADGRYVAFRAKGRLDPRCPGRVEYGTYVRDTKLNRTECVSLDNAGREVESDPTGMSANGRYVVYNSYAGDRAIGGEVYVFDRWTRTRRQVDPGRGPDSAGGGSISADGRFVSFGYDDGSGSELSRSSRLRDLATGALTTLPFEPYGTCLSGNGRYVFYAIVWGESLPWWYYRYDRVTRQRVLVLENGGDTYFPGSRMSCSSDGTKLVFTGVGRHVISDTNERPDAYLATVSEKGTTLRQLSRSSTGAQGNDESTNPAISPDGKYVVYTSMASNLVPGDTNRSVDTYAINLTTGVTWRVSRGLGGAQASGNAIQALQSNAAATAPSGHAVLAYESWASNLVRNDTNNSIDVFVTSLG